MMLIGRYRPCTVSFLFPPWIFLQHLPNPTCVPLRPAGCQAKSVTAAGIHSSSDFDTLNCRQQDQIRLYVDALLQWNQKMNLTAVTEVEDVMSRHVEDSLALIPPIISSYTSHCSGSVDSLSVVDVGTGPGLPGMVLAIACPGWQVTLMESMKKRCDFLEHAVGITGLSNVQVVRGRAENLGQDVSYREQFDVAVARAVAEMRILVEYCLPLVRVGGLFVAAKGHNPEEEVKIAERSIQLMGASLLQLHPGEMCKCRTETNGNSFVSRVKVLSSSRKYLEKGRYLPAYVKSHSRHGQRTAIICLKGRSTPKKYPREPGTPAKLPL